MPSQRRLGISKQVNLSLGEKGTTSVVPSVCLDAGTGPCAESEQPTDFRECLLDSGAAILELLECFMAWCFLLPLPTSVCSNLNVSSLGSDINLTGPCLTSSPSSLCHSRLTFFLTTNLVKVILWQNLANPSMAYTDLKGLVSVCLSSFTAFLTFYVP